MEAAIIFSLFGLHLLSVFCAPLMNHTSSPEIELESRSLETFPPLFHFSTLPWQIENTPSQLEKPDNTTSTTSSWSFNTLAPLFNFTTLPWKFETFPWLNETTTEGQENSTTSSWNYTTLPWITGNWNFTWDPPLTHATTLPWMNETSTPGDDKLKNQTFPPFENLTTSSWNYTTLPWITMDWNFIWDPPLFDLESSKWNFTTLPILKESWNVSTPSPLPNSQP